LQKKYDRHGINKNTYEIIFNEKEEGKKECSKEIFTIEMSSRKEKEIIMKPFIILKRIIEMYFYEINYFHIHKNLFSKGYTYKCKSGNFKFYYLEKYLNKILKYEDKYVKKELLFNIKNNLISKICYETSIIIASNIENSYLVTGLIEFEDGKTHLHSYVEYKEYIIDYTKNLIMKKDKYYELLKIKELNRIKQENISYIFNLLSENKILNTTRYIATFGEEIKKDLEKNKQIIKTPKKDKSDFSMFYW